MKNTINKSTLLFAAMSAVSCGEAEDANYGHRPNILIAIADDQSYPHAGAYGCEWVNTPAFDRVAQDGILLTGFYTPNSKSAPSRASLLTGMYSWQLEDIGNHLACWPEGRFTTVFEALAANGYHAGFTGKGWAPGDPGKVDGKPRRLTGEPYQSHKLTPPTSGIAKVDYASNFGDFLSDAEDGQPWIFWYGSREPHRAFEYGTGASLGGLTQEMIDKVPSYWPDTEVTRNDMLDYSFEISHFDSHLGRMIQMLEERGELDNTIIIVTADNGMAFPRRKGFGYEQSTHLPMAIMWPDGITSPGRTDSSLVSMADIAPTLLSLAGLEAEAVGMSPEGKDILDILSDSKKRKNRDFLLFGQERHDYGRPENQGYPIRSIQRDGFLYMYNFKPWLWPSCDPETGYLNTDGSPTKTQILNMRRQNPSDSLLWHLSFGKHPQEELYNLTADPECVYNLADDLQYSALKSDLQKTLFDELSRQGDPRLGSDGDVFDRYPFNDAANQDYYERYMDGEIEGYQTTWVNPDDYEKVEYKRQSDK